MCKAAFACVLGVMCALYGCLDSGPTGPVPDVSKVVASGTFRGNSPGSEGPPTEIQIAYGSIDSLEERTGADEGVTDIWTGPVSIAVPWGDDRVKVILARFDSDRLQLRYLARADGLCIVVGRILHEDGDIRVALDLQVRSENYAGADGAPTMDNIWSIPGYMTLTFEEGEAAVRLVSRELVISIYGNRLLSSNLEN